MMKLSKIFSATVLFAMVLSGCNTIHGVGEDLTASGQALSKAATHVRHSDEHSKTSTKNTVTVSGNKSPT